MTSELAVSSAASPRRWNDCAAAPVRLVLTLAVIAHVVLLAVLVLLAALVDQQGDILANRSEAHGGFNPSVFPPYSDGIWLATNGSVVLAFIVLVVLIALNLTLRRRAPQ